jgi:hypothetical protein
MLNEYSIEQRTTQIAEGEIHVVAVVLIGLNDRPRVYYFADVSIFRTHTCNALSCSAFSWQIR